jgi:hypothetical protein
MYMLVSGFGATPIGFMSPKQNRPELDASLVDAHCMSDHFGAGSGIYVNLKVGHTVHGIKHAQEVYACHWPREDISGIFHDMEQFSLRLTLVVVGSQFPGNPRIPNKRKYFVVVRAKNAYIVEHFIQETRNIPSSGEAEDEDLVS